jgi:DnaJ-class molecular chaperone
MDKKKKQALVRLGSHRICHHCKGLGTFPLYDKETGVLLQETTCKHCGGEGIVPIKKK